mmetsp:Transcript_7765/g.19222  ORF Transcript_7765/g.19222 Transcript_7765/m.19222 type:complete len:161 (+) Transcript_7765:569-1051(+)
MVPARTAAEATGDYRTKLSCKVDAVCEALREGKFGMGMVHVKAVDDMGHDKDVEGKLRWIERADEMVGELVERLERGDAGEHEGAKRFALVVTADHSTPVEYGDHSFEPVPFLAANVGVEGEWGSDAATRFDEIECAVKGSLGRFLGSEIPWVMETLTRQ